MQYALPWVGQRIALVCVQNIVWVPVCQNILRSCNRVFCETWYGLEAVQLGSTVRRSEGETRTAHLNVRMTCTLFIAPQVLFLLSNTWNCVYSTHCEVCATLWSSSPIFILSFLVDIASAGLPRRYTESSFEGHKLVTVYEVYEPCMVCSCSSFQLHCSSTAE